MVLNIATSAITINNQELGKSLYVFIILTYRAEHGFSATCILPFKPLTTNVPINRSQSVNLLYKCKFKAYATYPSVNHKCTRTLGQICPNLYASCFTKEVNSSIILNNRKLKTFRFSRGTEYYVKKLIHALGLAISP